MKRSLVVALVLVGVGFSACGSSRAKAIRRAAATDLACAEKHVDVDLLAKGDQQYLAKACGRRAVYTWSKQTGAMRISAIEGPENGTPPPPPPPPPGGATTSGPPPPPTR